MARSGTKKRTVLKAMRIENGIYDERDLTELAGAVDAVCAELGIERTDVVARERVAGRMMRSWAAGRRTPLGLVQAGLDGTP
ncbi:hypothetical protein [Nitratireductor thuwali]|uniref:Uncharacterized protein n=1 Tax=Nitratireductor thuwali TaxID=2267699 RepID=A0ABY5MGM9_9HYPH|nr:hypothetical protein NTH_00756 [Nitratireductor thuwali]